MNKRKKQSHKKILVVCQHFWPESFRLNDVCDYLVEKGYEVDVLCGIPNYPQGKFFSGYSYFHNRKQQHNGINIRRVFEIPRGNGSNIRITLNNLSFVIASMFHIPRLLMRKYDKVFIYELSPVMMALPGIIVGKLKKIETTMWVIDIWPDNLFSYLNIKNSLLRKIATSVSYWHYRHVDKLIALTDGMRNRLIEITNIDNDSIIALPQACEKLHETAVRDKKLEKRFSKGFNILFTGTITPLLSFETVIGAAVALKNRGFADINWIIVGDGSARNWLEQEVKRQGLTDNFHFEGFKPMSEIPKYTTSAADVLLSTLVKNELLEVTVPAKISSYLATGKPIVLAMDGEAQRLINDVIGCGYAGPAENADVLAKNIEKVYRLLPAKRKALGNKAREYHFAHQERNLVMQKLEAFILR